MKNLHRLLQRQLKKYYPDFTVFPDSIRPLIEAINQSYLHFEANQALVDRAMRISSDELSASNRKLRDESERQKLILQELKNAIHSVSPGDKIAEDDDLLKIIDILKEEIDKRKQVENDLKSAREAAESSLQIKKIFLANISHEIRTPINGIVGMSALLSESGLTEVQRDYLQAIKSSAEGLMVIINDILDMSKLESGKFTLEYIPFKLRHLLSTLQRSFSLRAEEKGLSLEFQSDQNIAEVLEGDPTRLNQVLINLLSNAIKFTDKGGVVFKAELVAGNAENQKIRFTVKDTGVGIDDEKVKLIFEQFTQEDLSISRKYGGTGLGLSISKELVGMMNGQLKVVSAKGSGSEFSFEIDLKVSASIPDLDFISGQDLSLGGARVLIVEDNDINRYLGITLLRRWDCKVTSATNGLEAVDIIRKAEFDVVLMDLQMPEMDGFEATKIIRQQFQNNVPIVALTANALSSERELCFSLGMNNYLCKPYRAEELFSTLSAVLNAFNARHGEKKGPSWSLSKLDELYNRNTAHVTQTVGIFIDQLASDTGALVKLAREKDYEGLKKICHRLRPNVELFCAVEVLNELTNLESLISEKKANSLESVAENIFSTSLAVITGLKEYEGPKAEVHTE